MSGDAFVDTNVWLYALVVKPGEETKHDRAKQLIADLSRCTVSTQVVAEVSVNREIERTVGQGTHG
jgi:predicted nucleic acid-binding protein